MCSNITTCITQAVVRNGRVIRPRPFCDVHKVIPLETGIPVSDILRDDHLQEAIRTRAYFLWEQAGRPHGHSDYFWALARSEFDLWNGGVK